jgi:hypothetical protein
MSPAGTSLFFRMLLDGKLLTNYVFKLVVGVYEEKLQAEYNTRLNVRVLLGGLTNEIMWLLYSVRFEYRKII